MQNLLFDLDGTLTDPAPGIVRCLQFALQSVGASPRSDHELRHFIGPPLHEAFRILLDTNDPDIHRQAIRSYRERFAARGLYENAVYPEIPQLLADLCGAGFQLWVVTSKPTVYADRIVDHFRLRPFFADVYGSELSGERSAKAELLAHILHAERIDPVATCMIGDREHDVAGARAHGVPALGVLWGYGTRAELESAGATALVMSPAVVPEAIRLMHA
jgi:phosphoglycolate phosphatase